MPIQPSSRYVSNSLDAPTTTSTHNKISSLKDKKKKKKCAVIKDKFSSLEQVTAALRDTGLESSNLILGIDFTKSNEWTGKVSFNNRSLHAVGDTPNPYEEAISIIGKTLAPLDEDNLIPCFGFGDATTHDENVFSFHVDHSPCHGFEGVLACYRKILPYVQLAGPTSYAPVIEAAIDIVEKNNGRYHVLVIISDGQVRGSVNTSAEEEKKTIKSIVNASSHPLSIVLVGVGDGPWEDMQKFDDEIPARKFDNFQFVNFTSIMSRNTTPAKKESAFALAALMEIPCQYTAAVELGIMKCTTRGAKNIVNSAIGSVLALYDKSMTSRAKKKVPLCPPVPYEHCKLPELQPSHVSSSVAESQACPICLANDEDLAFGCGHRTCRECGSKFSNCPICHQRMTARIRLHA